MIGGGDWSLNRLVPDCVRAWALNNKVKIRSPNSTRPWQHVLEPLSGYITLSYHLKKNKKINGGSFNFGPQINEVATVKKVLQISQKYWKGSKFKFYKEKFFKEDPLLKLNSTKAQKILKWKKVLSLEKTLELTMTWYNEFYKINVNVSELLNRDISYFLKLKKNNFDD